MTHVPTIVIVKGCSQLLAGVHYKRAVGGDRLVQGQARQYQYAAASFGVKPDHAIVVSFKNEQVRFRHHDVNCWFPPLFQPQLSFQRQRGAPASSS